MWQQVTEKLLRHCANEKGLRTARQTDAALDANFLSEAKEAGLVTLKGHRSVGGMRASIYNAMPEEGVRALVGFMANFENRHG